LPVSVATGAATPELDEPTPISIVGGESARRSKVDRFKGAPRMKSR
jgi:hypothetical protein